MSSRPTPAPTSIFSSGAADTRSRARRIDVGRRERTSMHQFDLNGRRAVITGGAQGFGRAIAERFLQSGARVMLWDRDQDVLHTAADELKPLGEAHTALVDV